LKTNEQLSLQIGTSGVWGKYMCKTTNFGGQVRSKVKMTRRRC